MNFVYQLLQAESFARLGITLIHSLWQLSLLAVIFKLYLATLHKHNAQLRYWGAMAFLFAAIAIPSSTFLAVDTGRAEGPVAGQPAQVVTTADVDDSFQTHCLLGTLLRTWRKSRLLQQCRKGVISQSLQLFFAILPPGCRPSPRCCGH